MIEDRKVAAEYLIEGMPSVDIEEIDLLTSAVLWEEMAKMMLVVDEDEPEVLATHEETIARLGWKCGLMNPGQVALVMGKSIAKMNSVVDLHTLYHWQNLINDPKMSVEMGEAQVKWCRDYLRSVGSNILNENGIGEDDIPAVVLFAKSLPTKDRINLMGQTVDLLLKQMPTDECEKMDWDVEDPDLYTGEFMCWLDAFFLLKMAKDMGVEMKTSRVKKRLTKLMKDSDMKTVNPLIANLMIDSLPYVDMSTDEQETVVGSLWYGSRSWPEDSDHHDRLRVSTIGYYLSQDRRDDAVVVLSEIADETHFANGLEGLFRYALGNQERVRFVRSLYNELVENSWGEEMSSLWDRSWFEAAMMLYRNEGLAYFNEPEMLVALREEKIDIYIDEVMEMVLESGVKVDRRFLDMVGARLAGMAEKFNKGQLDLRETFTFVSALMLYRKKKSS